MTSRKASANTTTPPNFTPSSYTSLNSAKCQSSRSIRNTSGLFTKIASMITLSLSSNSFSSTRKNRQSLVLKTRKSRNAYLMSYAADSSDQSSRPWPTSVSPAEVSRVLQLLSAPSMQELKQPRKKALKSRSSLLVLPSTPAKCLLILSSPAGKH